MLMKRREKKTSVHSDSRYKAKIPQSETGRCWGVSSSRYTQDCCCQTGTQPQDCSWDWRTFHYEPHILAVIGISSDDNTKTHILTSPVSPTKNYCYCSVTKSCLTLCDPMDCNTPGFPVFHYPLEFTQTHVHYVDNVIQPSHPLLPSSPSAFCNLSQHQDLFQRVSSSHQAIKVLELQLQHQSSQWIFRLDFL